MDVQYLPYLEYGYNGRNNLTVLAYLFRPGSAGSLCGYGSRLLGWNTQCSLFRPLWQLGELTFKGESMSITDLTKERCPKCKGVDLMVNSAAPYRQGCWVYCLSCQHEGPVRDEYHLAIGAWNDEAKRT